MTTRLGDRQRSYLFCMKVSIFDAVLCSRLRFRFRFRLGVQRRHRRSTVRTNDNPQQRVVLLLNLSGLPSLSARSRPLILRDAGSVKLNDNRHIVPPNVIELCVLWVIVRNTINVDSSGWIWRTPSIRWWLAVLVGTSSVSSSGMC